MRLFAAKRGNLTMSETKKIYIMEENKKVLKHMTYEEIHEMFIPLVERNVIDMNRNMFFNRYSEEDIRQEFFLQLWVAYDRYSAETGNCFTTYLHHRMKRASDTILQPTKAKKREDHGKEISLNKEVITSGSEAADELQDLLIDGSDSVESTHDGKELLSLIENAIMKDRDKELLELILDRKKNGVVDYAEAKGITPQAAHARIRTLKAHLQGIIKSSYLE